jgi:hypothetical protein
MMAELSVLVLGMHRSGTSAVAGLLAAAGLNAGRQDGSSSIRLENPDGFFERDDVVAYDERLLAALGWTWDTPDALPLSRPPDLADLVEEGRRLFEADALDGGTWLAKDPRMSLLLPWWRRILLDRVVAVVCLRDAAEVSWSLAVRDGFPHELGLSLWAAYHRHLAAGLNGLPTVAIDYGALTERPLELVEKLLGALETLGVSAAHDRDAAVAAVRPELRRSTQPGAANGDGRMAESVLALGRLWTEPGALWMRSRFEMAPSTPSGWEVALLDGHRRARDAEQAIATLADSARQGRQAFAVLQVEREDLRRQLAALNTDVSAARAAEQSTRRLNEQLVERSNALNAEVRSLRSERDAARSKLERQAARIAALTAEAEAARARYRAEYAKRRHSLTRRATEWPRRVGRRFRDLAVRGAVRLVPPHVLAYVWHNPLFDGNWYLDQYREVRDLRSPPERHFRRVGAQERRNPNALFDTGWYLDTYPDVARSRFNPLDHYLLFGGAEGRSPSSRFDGAWYLRSNPDVAASGYNPLLHYLRHGRAEGRRPLPANPG